MAKFNKINFTPKLFSTLKDGYGFTDLRIDIFAGLTVAVVALPLAMALGIACGASPENGLLTAIIAGFLISLFGGSRVQIGGPTGAFVVVVFNIIAKHGYEGLIIATLLAGIILVLAGFANFGQIIKFIPQPVVIGFTSGIAVIIASSQLKYFTGLNLDNISSEIIFQWIDYFNAFDTISFITLSVGIFSLLAIIIIKKFAPKWPNYLIVMGISSLIVTLFNIPVETVGSRFPDISSGISLPQLPIFTITKIKLLLPSAFTIAFLAGIEALLSAMVADGMTGYKHRPNQELIGQGIANIGSAFFGGLPATGAIARTATNITAGGKTPIAGIFHSIFILIFIFFGMDNIKFIPMTVLSAILFIVAWGMSEIHQFIRIFRLSGTDRISLILTFLLTIFVDLTIAIGVGITLSSLLFMNRMSKSVEISNTPKKPEKITTNLNQREALPNGVEVFWISGPIFFGMANELIDILKRIGYTPRVLIIRMRLVPYLDGTGASALIDLVKQCHKNNTKIIFSSIQTQPIKILSKFQKDLCYKNITYTHDYTEAITLAKEIIDNSTT